MWQPVTQPLTLSRHAPVSHTDTFPGSQSVFKSLKPALQQMTSGRAEEEEEEEEKEVEKEEEEVVS